MRDKFQNPESERLRQFAEMREQTHKAMEVEIAQREKENPIPTEGEILAGAFRETIEPQVRDALFEFYSRGYSTESSGFYGGHGEVQAIDGYFEIDDETKEEIEALGAEVLKKEDLGLLGESDSFTQIRFKPERADMDEMRGRWSEIAALLPQRDKVARPSLSGSSEDFRKQYAPNRTDLELKMLQSRLDHYGSDQETEQEMRARIEELSE